MEGSDKIYKKYQQHLLSPQTWNLLHHSFKLPFLPTEARLCSLKWTAAFASPRPLGDATFSHSCVVLGKQANLLRDG